MMLVRKRRSLATVVLAFLGVGAVLRLRLRLLER